MTPILPGGPEDLDQYLNRWIPLPAMGKNSIMVKRRERPHPRPLLMFPKLEQLGLEIMFHSNWSQEHILLVEVDILKCCPQRQIWPYCAWCKRFLCPADGHRNGKLHAGECYPNGRRKVKGCRYYLDTCDVEYLRHQMGFWDVQARWL